MMDPKGKTLEKGDFDLGSAVKFIETRGNSLEKARLNFLLRGEIPPEKTYKEIIEIQKEDGGWSLPEYPVVSSLDFTCFQLAQLEELGLKEKLFITRTFNFLLSRQAQDGSFTEDFSLEKVSPPWSKPGEPKATLYLTVLCGYWLEFMVSGNDPAQKAAKFLVNNLNKDGLLPSFRQANWLAVPFFYKSGFSRESDKIKTYFTGLVDKMPPGQLVWLLNSWGVMGIELGEEFKKKAFSNLAGLQEKDGGWGSQDGENYRVHVALGAIRFFLSLQENAQ